MKHLFAMSVAVVSLALVGCGETGDKALKGAARAILEDEQPQQAQPIQQPQQMQPAQQPQQVQVQSTQPVAQEIQVVEVVEQPVQVVQKPVPVKQVQQKVQIIYQGHIMTQSDGYVYMRNSPKASAKKIKKLPDYTPVNVISCGNMTTRWDPAARGDTGSWCKVISGGTTGYVFDAYIQ